MKNGLRVQTQVPGKEHGVHVHHDKTHNIHNDNVIHQVVNGISAKPALKLIKKSHPIILFICLCGFYLKQVFLIKYIRNKQ